MARLATLRPGLAVTDHRTCAPPAKRADPELQTAAHEAWRKEVLNRAGWKCQSCGKRGGRGHSVRLFADHIVERQDGGAALDPKNGQCLCGSCHTKKTGQERARRMGLGEDVAFSDRAGETRTRAPERDNQGGAGGEADDCGLT